MAQHPWTHHNQANQVGMIPAIDGDEVFEAFVVTNATQNVYVVPANKTLLVFDYTIDINITGAIAGYLSAYAVLFNVGSGTEYRFISHSDNLADFHHSALSLFMPMALQQGWFIQLSSNSVNAATLFSMHGILIDT